MRPGFSASRRLKAGLRTSLQQVLQRVPTGVDFLFHGGEVFRKVEGVEPVVLEVFLELGVETPVRAVAV